MPSPLLLSSVYSDDNTEQTATSTALLRNNCEPTTTDTTTSVQQKNNGFLRNKSAASSPGSSQQQQLLFSAEEPRRRGGDSGRLSPKLDLTMSELGSSSTPTNQHPNIDIVLKAKNRSLSHNSKDRSSICLQLRHFRCQLIFVLIAFIEFAVLIAGITFYLSGVMTSCEQTTRHVVPEKTMCLTEECVRTASSLLSAMDTTADPCVNFFQYACGTWNKKHAIPEDRSSISTFEVLADQQQVILKGLLEEPISDTDNKATIKAKMFYNTCMDIQQIRAVGDSPLKDVLRSLGGWPVIEKNWKAPKFSKEQLFGRLRGEFSEPVLFELYVGADDKNSSANILQLEQLVLALPSRDYYLKASSEGDLQAYHKYMVQIAVLLGADPETASDELQEVVKFEMQLANASLPEADRHDTSAVYKKITLRDLQHEVPQIKWIEYIQMAIGEGTKLNHSEPIVCYAMSYLVQMGRILEGTDRRVVHNYVIWRLVMSIMTHLIDDYQRERVEYRKILLGIQTERPRWSQCVEWTNKKLGMAVGALFIRDNFD